MKKLVVLAVVMVIAAGGAAAIVAARSSTTAEPKMQEPTGLVADETKAQEPQQTGGSMSAMEEAAEAKKYLFALFWREENDQTAAMRRVLKEVMEEVTDRADSVEVNVRAASERAIVDKFGLDRAPMPLILALAPNGAVTGGFPTGAERQELLEAFASPCTEECMKLLQDGKLVFLCIQNSSTNSNKDAMQGVRDFEADSRFAQATEIVMLDPTDAGEAKFLKDLQVDPKTEEAVTVFLAPPGVPIAEFKGATDKDGLIAILQKASSACGPGGCGPGGCGPRQ